MTTLRSAALDDVLMLTQAAIAGRVGDRTDAAHAMRRVAEALSRPVAQPVTQSSPPLTLPVCAHLEGALCRVERGPADLASLARALRTLSPHICWRRRSGGDPAFQNGHANADLVGSSQHALEQRDDVWIGLSLMAPGITYPDHRHLPEEVYLVLSGGDWRQNQEAWHEPGLGGLVYNPPDIVHAMRSGPESLLAIWCLPIQ